MGVFFLFMLLFPIALIGASSLLALRKRPATAALRVGWQ
jgi:hypothetical protein